MVKWGQLIEGGKSPWTKITPSSFLKIERSAQKEEWYFSVQDVVAVLSESADPKQYTKKMRARDPQLSANWGCCKIKSYLQQPLSFLGGQSVECRTLHFSVQAKPTHAESVIFVYGKQTCSGFVVLGRLFQAVFGSNSAFPNRPSASRLHSFRILNAIARIKRRVSLLVFPRVRNLSNP